MSRDILILLSFVVPVYAALFIGFHYTPMYQQAKVDEREGARLAVIENRRLGLQVDESIIERYNFTAEELAAGSLLEDILARQDGNLGR